MDIKLADIIFQIINFSIVVGALTYLLYKPVLKILEERAKKVKTAQADAEATIAQKQKTEKETDQIINKAHKQAQEIIDMARKKAQTQAKQIIDQAKDQAKKSTQKAATGWEKEKQTMIDQLRSQYVNDVTAITEKVLAGILDKKTQQQYITQQLDSIIKSI